MEKSTCRYKNVIELDDGRKAKMFKPLTIHLMKMDCEWRCVAKAYNQNSSTIQK